MIAIYRCAVVLALGASFVTAPYAAHAESAKDGGLCGFTTLTDPTGQANTQTGYVDAGPISIVDDTDPAIVHTGHLTCTIQVGSSNSTHLGTDAASISGPDAPYVADLSPYQLTFSAGPNDAVYLCTSVTTDEGGGPWYGQTWYYDDLQNPTVDGSWSTDPTTSCRLVVSASADGGKTSFKTAHGGSVGVRSPGPGGESMKLGPPCRYPAVAGPTDGPAAEHSGTIDGGPVLIVDDTDPTTVHTGHLTCSVDVCSYYYGGCREVASVSGPDTPFVVELPPTDYHYVADPAWDYATVRASVTTEEGTWCFHEDALLGYWGYCYY